MRTASAFPVYGAVLFWDRQRDPVVENYPYRVPGFGSSQGTACFERRFDTGPLATYVRKHSVKVQ